MLFRKGCEYSNLIFLEEVLPEFVSYTPNFSCTCFLEALLKHVLPDIQHVLKIYFSGNVFQNLLL